MAAQIAVNVHGLAATNNDPLAIGDVAGSTVVEIVNNGDAACDVTDIDVGGGVFSAALAGVVFPITLDPAESMTLVIELTTDDSSTGTISVVHDAPGFPFTVDPLSWTLVDVTRVITIDGETAVDNVSLNIDNVSGVVTLRITNDAGSADNLTITAVNSEAGGVTAIEEIAWPVTLEPGEFQDVVLTVDDEGSGSVNILCTEFYAFTALFEWTSIPGTTVTVNGDAATNGEALAIGPNAEPNTLVIANAADAFVDLTIEGVEVDGGITLTVPPSITFPVVLGAGESITLNLGLGLSETGTITITTTEDGEFTIDPLTWTIEPGNAAKARRRRLMRGLYDGMFNDTMEITKEDEDKIKLTGKK